MFTRIFSKMFSIFLIMLLLVVSNPLTVFAATGTIGAAIAGSTAFITSTEFDTPDMVSIGGNRYALAYDTDANSGSGDCNLAIISVSAAGAWGGVLDDKEFGVDNNYNCQLPQIAYQSSGDYIAGLYRNKTGRVELANMSVDSNGSLTAVGGDGEISDVFGASGQSVDLDIMPSYDQYILELYNNSGLVAETRSITATGSFSAVISKITVDASISSEGGDMVNMNLPVEGQGMYNPTQWTYVSATGIGSSNDAKLNVFTITNHGTLTAVSSATITGSSDITGLDLLPIGSHVFLLTYVVGGDGVLETRDNSSLSTVIDSYTFDASWAQHPELVEVEDGLYAIAYEGYETGVVEGLAVTTIEVDSSGNIASAQADHKVFSIGGDNSDADNQILSIGGDNFLSITKGSATSYEGLYLTFPISGIEASVPEFSTYMYIVVLMFGFFVVKQRYSKPFSFEKVDS